MFFVVEKSRFQRIIAITRDDRTAKQQFKKGPFFRMEARDGVVKLTGNRVEAEFPATVYAPGVLFLKVTFFHRALQGMVNTPTVAIQVSPEGLHVGDVTMPLESNDMLFYPDRDRAPAQHPDEVDEPKPPAQGMLFPEE